MLVDAQRAGGTRGDGAPAGDSRAGGPKANDPQASGAPSGAPDTAASPVPSARMLERARGRATDPEVARDMETLGGMVQIWCADHHDADARTPYAGFGVQCGAYRPKRVPSLCPECAAHLEYGELRRCLCPHDPKPSCRVCDIHCYKPAEAAWQRQVMAYAGPRAMFRGMFVDAVRHMRSELGSRRAHGKKGGDAPNGNGKKDAGR